MENNQEVQLRLEALRMSIQINATRANSFNELRTNEIVEQANDFFKFLKGE